MAQSTPPQDAFYIDGHDRRRVNILKASEMAGVTTRTIYNWMYQGKVEYVRTAGGHVRIFADSLWRTNADL